MGWFRRKPQPANQPVDTAALQHLATFVQSRQGVEGFIEPVTRVTQLTLLLVAHDGEWTRRRIGDPQTAYTFGHQHAIPIYDVNRVGYPQRMRDWNHRNRGR